MLRERPGGGKFPLIDETFWMSELFLEQRVLISTWKKSEGSIMKDGVSEIHLTAVALSGSDGYVKIHYDFENTDACRQKRKSKRSGTL
jgi:hypothetical protein